MEEQQPKQDLIQEFKVGEDTYVYSFNETTVDRILQAQRLFRLDFELLKQLPKQPSELAVTVERQTQRNAFAAILMKRMPHGGYEDYNPATGTGMKALQTLTGKDFARLQECMLDFFRNSGLWSEYSTMQFASQMKDALELFKGLSPEQISVVGTAIRENTDSLTENSTENSSTMPDIIQEISGNLSTGQ